MKKNLIVTGLVALTVCIMMVISPAQAKNYKWRIGTIVPKESLMGETLTMFAKKVEKKTDGQMKIQVGYNSAFGGWVDGMKAVSMGSLEMVTEDLGSWEMLNGNFRILRFPYTFSSWDHYYKYINSPAFKPELAALAEKNHHIIIPNNKVNWKRGPFRCILAKRPIFTAKDLEGLKLRLYESEVAKRIWRHMGCKITVLPWGEAYLGLKQGMVEAITTPMSQTYNMKFHEVAPYITNINEFLQNNTIGVDKKKWEKLPPDIQRAMVDAINEAAIWSNETLDQRVENDIQNMLKEGAYFIRVGLDSFKKKISPLAAEFEKEGAWRKGLHEEIQKLQ